MPEAQTEAEQFLKADDPGVFRQKAGLVAKNFANLKADTWADGEIHFVTGFRLGGLSFRLCMIHNKECLFGLEFRCDTDIKVTADWSISIVNPSGETLATSIVAQTDFAKENGEYDNDRDFSWASLEDDKFCHYDAIKDCLVDGDLHLVADILFKVLEGGFAESSPTENPFLSAFRSQLDCPLFPDLTLVAADGQEIKTHRLLLALQSRMFLAMLENDMEEARTGVIKIEDSSALSIKAMLAFLVGVEPQQWTFDLAKCLFELADKYEFSHLLQRSSVELMKGLTTKNLADVLLLAHQHSAKGLLNGAFEFLEDNLNQAILDGVLERLISADAPKMLFRKWRAHAFRRKEGVDMEEAE